MAHKAIHGYCMSCRANHEMQNPKKVKRGSMTMMTGTCPHGHEMWKIPSHEDVESMAYEDAEERGAHRAGFKSPHR